MSQAQIAMNKYGNMLDASRPASIQSFRKSVIKNEPVVTRMETARTEMFVFDDKSVIFRHLFGLRLIEK